MYIGQRFSQMLFLIFFSHPPFSALTADGCKRTAKTVLSRRSCAGHLGTARPKKGSDLAKRLSAQRRVAPKNAKMIILASLVALKEDFFNNTLRMVENFSKICTMTLGIIEKKGVVVDKSREPDDTKFNQL